MAVLIGSARSDEKGGITGGQAGNQTGKELSTQNWYRHGKGWRAFRAKSAEKAAKIARAMKSACENRNIGYDQYQRNALYNLVKPYGFDPAKADKPTETDCSALVRVCCCYAGIMVGDFNTGTEASMLLATGEFIELTGDKYTAQDSYLGAGDILVTRTKGHTVVVLTNGSKYEGTVQEPAYVLGDRILKAGMSGSDVRQLQIRLKAVGFDCGDVNGIYGSQTQGAVRALQEAGKITPDGEFGPNSLAVLESLEPAEGAPDAPPEPEVPITPPDGAAMVKITGGSVNLRSGPGTSYDAVDVAHLGDLLPQANPDGWLPVLLDGRVCWVSPKYAEQTEVQKE